MTAKKRLPKPDPLPKSLLTSQEVREAVMDDLDMLGVHTSCRQGVGLLHLLNKLALARSSVQEARAVADLREIFLEAFGPEGLHL